MNASVLQPGAAGPTQSGLVPDPAAGRSTRLPASVLLTSVGVGVLVGIAEVCWSYLLPIFNEQWRAVLPTSLGGLIVFVAAAVATDGLLGLGVGALWLLCLSLITRLARIPRTSKRLHMLARAVILWGGLCYLYIGWLVLFVVLGGQFKTFACHLLLIGGATALLPFALLVDVLLTATQRRWQRITRGVMWCAAVAVLFLALAVPFWRYRASQETGRNLGIAASTSGPRPNVLLITLDTLRADYLGCYGHPWIQSPAVDRLALDGVAFDTAISQAPSTTPSHCSIMTSLYPFDHDAENGKPMRRGLITLADVLRANGYETVAFTSATTTRSINTGLQQGFDHYGDSLVSWSEFFGRDEFQQLIIFYVLGVAKDSQIPGEVVTDRALRWLKNRSNKPFFVWLHYFDPHYPYGSPPPFRGMYRGKAADGLPMSDPRERYAEDITYADYQLGRFVNALKKLGLYDKSLIVVTGDHGEAFGEKHGDICEAGHDHYLYDTTQRVPLVIKPAGARLLGRRVSDQVELIDLAPTILDLLDIDTPRSFRGQSLAGLLEGRPSPYPPRDAYSFNVVRVRGAAKYEVSFAQQIAVRSPEWKFITRPRLNEQELYNLLEDPAETTNVAGAHPELVQQRIAQVAPLWDATRDSSQDPHQRLAPALVRQLQALGYLGDSADDQDQTAPGDK